MKKRLLSIACIIAILLTNTATLSIAAIAFNEVYKVNENEKLISRIKPETTIETFKSNTSEQLTVYKDETKTEKVDTGLIGTGMVAVKYTTGEEYTVSVIGDLNGDGKATQVELTNIIRHIVGLEGAELTGIKYESADITGDKAVDQRDITKLIKYIVTGELDIDNDNKNQSIIDATTKEENVDSVKIEVIVKDSATGAIKDAKVTVYVKKSGEPDTSYNKKYTGTDSELTIDGLDADTDYDIKIEAKDEQGNVITKVIKAKTANIEGDITFGTITWSSGKASTTVATASSYEIEYQINSKTGTWLKADSEANQITVDNLAHNDKLYARLINGTSTTEPKELTIKDEIVPTVSLSLTEGTQKLTAIATAIDNESGIAADVKYKFSIKEKDANDSTYVEKQNTTSATCEITGLTEEKEYTVKVEVSDIAGNVGTKEETIMIPDDISPVVGLTLAPTTSTIVATATATDVGGLPTNTIYKFSIKKTSEDDSQYAVKQNTTDKTCTITGLEQNTSYTVKVEVEDKAGNVGTKTETTTTTSVPDSTVSGAITFSSATWSDGKAEITVSTNTSYTIEYQVNGTTEGSWIKASSAGTDVTVDNLNNNDIVYARLTDGTNAGNYASATIMDTTEPTVTLTLSGVTTSSITATASAIDNESGIVADATYKFSIKKVAEDDSSYVVKQNTTDKTCMITGLQQNTEYTVKVEVDDIAGNTGSKTATQTTGTVPNETQTGAITFGSATWISCKASITISTNTSYIIEYQVNGITEGSWTRASAEGTDVTVDNLNNNNIVYARLTDGTNAGNYASVTIADTTKPTVISVSVTSNSITFSATDSESGIVGYKVTTSSTEPSSFDSCTTTNTLTNKQVTGLSENTTYYIWLKDAAGNVSTSYSIKTSDILISSITLNKTTLELTEGDEEILTATISPANATNKEVTWTTNADSIATVDTTGKVTAVAEGAAIITATAKDGSGKSASCTVTVESAIKAEYVNYPIDLNGDGDTTNDWMLFYKADGNAEGEESGGSYKTNVGDYYIIAADYLKNTDSRLKLSQMGTVKTYDPYGVCWKNIPSDLPSTPQKTGIETLTGTGRTINQLFMQNKFGALNDKDNSLTVSMLINTDNWTGYVNTSYADYAIGAPTLEMWVASWNATYGEKLKLYTNIESGIGYYIGTDSNSTTNTDDIYITTVTGWQNNKLYFPHGNSTYNSCTGSWVASPSAWNSEADRIMNVTYKGCLTMSGPGNGSMCLRPVVHLKSGTTLEKNASGIWEIK